MGRSGRIMQGLAGIARWVAGAALAFAGFAKLQDPAPAAEFLHSLLYVNAPSLVTALGLAEVALGFWLISGAAPGLSAAAGSAAFAAFAVAHAFARSKGVDQPCGCLGKSALTESMTPAAWLGLNIALSAACAAAAVLTGRSRFRENNAGQASEAAA